MIPGSTHTRLVVLFLSFVFAATIVVLKFGSVAEAGRSPATSPRAAGERAVSLREPLGFGKAVTARRAQQNSRIVNIQDGRDVETANLASSLSSLDIDIASARPLALASEELNGDSYPDLVCGYSSSKGGFLLIYYGSARAFAPSSPQDIRDQIDLRFPEPFSRVAVIKLDNAPDFIATGDFDRDGQVDILTASVGGNTLDVASGNSSGFEAPRSLELPGTITALAAGEKTQPESYGKAYVAINGAKGSQLLIFDGEGSIFSQQPEMFSVPDSASSLALGRLDEDRFEDVAMVAGGRLYVQHGDRGTVSAKRLAADKKAGKLESVELPFDVSSVALSDFIWDRDQRMELAVSSGDGSVRVLGRGALDTKPLSQEEIRARRPLAAESLRGDLPAAELMSHNDTDGWRVAENVSEAAAVKSLNRPVSLRGMLASAQNSYDLLMVNADAHAINIAYKDGEALSRREAVFNTTAEPIVVLPMRMNVHGHAGLVVLQEGKVEPTFMMFAPSATFTVTKGTDTADSVCDADCSLREAVTVANGAAGADSITVGTFTHQLAITGDENSGSTGDLDVNGDVTFMGNGAASTFVQGSTSAAFAGNMGDKAIGINQSGSFTTLIVTVTNLTVRFTRNDVTPNLNFTQTGGSTDVFLTGTGASPGPTATFTNVTYDSNASLHSYGGALNVDSGSLTPPTSGVFRGTVQITGGTFSNNRALGTAPTDPATGGGINLFGDIQNVTISGSTITANQTSLAASSNGGGINLRQSNGGTVTINSGTAITNNISGSDGGGLMIPGVGGQIFSMTGGSITGNTATGTGGDGDGGGVFNGNPTNTTSFTSVNISNNVATAGANGRGGGIEDVSIAPLTVDSCTITGNSADNGAGIAVLRGGASSATVTNSVLTGNLATGGTGGAFLVSSGILNASLNYINTNTATNGQGIGQTGGTATVENNWWGCDGFPSAAGCQTGSGTFDADPRIDLKLAASLTNIAPNGTSTLTASVNTNTNNVSITPTVLNGRTINFAAQNGSVAPPSALIAALAATSTYTNNGTCGSTTESATLDATPQNVTITVNCPATVVKTYSPTTIVQNNGFSVLTITITNPAANTVALTGVGISDTFPAGTEVDATPTATNTCGGTFAPLAAATSIALSGGTIPIASSCAISVRVRGTTAGTKNNTTGAVTSTNGGTGGTASATLTVTNTVTWNGATSAAWTTNTNWTPNVVPVSTNDVDIPTGAIPNNPTISTAVTVNNLTEAAARTLTIGAGASFTGTGSCTINGTVNVAGSATCGSLSGTGTVNFTGTVAQSIPALTYQNLGVTNAAGVNLAGNVTVNGVLNMGGGNINAGANTLTIGTAGSVTRTSGSVIGNLVKSYGATGSFTYPVGTATGFSPVTVNVTALGTNPSDLLVKANDGTVPAVPALVDATTLNRYWTVTETGNLTANVTFNYLQTDVRGTEANYRTIVVSGTNANLLGNVPPCPGAGPVCVDTTANTIFVSGLTVFSNWTAGELAPTAAGVDVSGRVLTPEGRGAAFARVALTRQDGMTMFAITNPFGYYRFVGVTAGHTYTMSVTSKQYNYQPRILTINEDLADVNFIPIP
jgi:CSLREA domain-containing protein